MPPPSPASCRLAQVDTGESIQIFNDGIGAKGTLGTLRIQVNPTNVIQTEVTVKGTPKLGKLVPEETEREVELNQGQAVGPQASCLTSLSCLSSFVKWRYFKKKKKNKNETQS